MKYPILMMLVIGLFLSFLGAVKTTPVSYALQGTARPTATNIGASSGDGGSSEAQPPLVGVVQGFVFDYSAGGAAQPGIAVILDGGGWQAETVTDSNGFYQFAGLGSGKATLNLRLPPGTHPILPDWPVHTHNPEATFINLAYYWGDVPPLPVILSIDPPLTVTPANQEFSFEVNVRNQSGGVASEGVVDLRLPAALEALEATTTHGRVDFSPHRIWGLLGQVADGETATLRVRAKFDEAGFPETYTAETVLNYREQLIPQLVRTEIMATQPAAQLAASPSPAGQAVTAQKVESPTPVPVDEGETTPQSDLPTTGAVNEPAEAPGEGTDATGVGSTGQGTEPALTTPADSASSEETSAEAVSSESAPAESALARADTESNSSPGQTDDLIPVTGEGVAGPSRPAWPLLLLSIMSIVGLGMAGLRTFVKRS